MRTSSATDEVVEKVKRKFDNGDHYTGGWKNGGPHGEGVYYWANGSKYDGSWAGGLKHGVGRYTWPSKSTYTGEWREGCMHGIGTFVAADDAAWYKGSWRRDMKQGLGKKKYENGDHYEGLWEGGKPHGPGRYRWNDNNEYDGAWEAGRMHGQGTFLWNSHERYDGGWSRGVEDGPGVFTWRDGSTFDGMWKAGKKEGLGLFRPAPRSEVTDTPLATATEVGDSDNEAAPSEASQGGETPVVGPNSPLGGGSTLPLEKALSRRGKTRLFLREYRGGKLRRSEPLSPSEAEKLTAILKRRQQQRGAAGRDVSGPGLGAKFGETVVKGHAAYDLMLNLQLGIRWSIGQNHQKENAMRECNSQDFVARMKQGFPHAGSAHTPPHPAGDFEWKDYCPTVFRKLRRGFGLDAAAYMLSLCGDLALRIMGSPGKSGAMFMISHDDSYLVKTVTDGEMDLLLKLMPRYYHHMSRNPHSLLTRFYGLYRITPVKTGKAVRFVVMGNIFNSNLKMHQIYDLKGSTHGRSAFKDDGKPASILKDLDVNTVFKLEQGWHERLIAQMKMDCKLLEELKIMDYSMLLGVHTRAKTREDAAERSEALRARLEEEEEAVKQFARDMQALRLDPKRVTDLRQLVELQMLGAANPSRSTAAHVLAMHPARSKTMRPLANSQGASDELGYSLGSAVMQLGLGMAATALPKEGTKAAEDVVLHFGIIDILQQYNLTKKLEHGFKSLTVSDSHAISAVNPSVYSSRFQAFMAGIFV